MSGVSIHAAHRGLESIGVKDNEVVVFSDLMDSKSLFLTANADTVYSIGVLDLTNGPMVLEVPPKMLGTVDDYWFRWVVDLGPPLRTRRRRHPHRRIPGRRRAARPGHNTASHGNSRRQRQGDEHHSTQ